MKAGWKVKPLGEVTSVINGLWKGKKGPYETAKVVRNTNFRPHGQLNLDDVAEIEVEVKQLEKRKLSKGDIVLERSGGGPKQPVGRVVLFDLDAPNFSFSNFTSVIRLTNREKVCPRFLHAQLNFWYAAGLTEPLQKQSTGIRNLDFKAYQQLPLIIPPLEEQKQIVAVLDAAFEGLNRAKENAEANLQNARELLEQSITSFMMEGSANSVGTRLENYCHFENGDRGKNYPGRKAFVETGVPFINAGHLEAGVIDWENMNYIPEEHFHRLSNGKIAKSDVLFCLRGSLGKFAIVDRDGLGAIASSLVIVRCGAGLLPEYLGLYFNSSLCREEIGKYEGGAAQPNLSAKSLRAFTIPVPDIEVQEELIRRFHHLKEMIAIAGEAYQAKLTDIADLRQSLLQKAFAGELT